jgi:hypothetical protein
MTDFVATPLTCASPDEEVLGIFLSWVAENLRSDVVRPVLAEHGLESYNLDTWYPTQSVLNVIRDLGQEGGVSEAFLAIGKQAAATYPFGPQVATIKDAVEALHQAHHDTNRNIHPDQGFLVEESGDGALIVTNNNPWPGDLIYAMLWELGRRFRPEDGSFTVQPLAPDQYGRAVFKVTYS